MFVFSYIVAAGFERLIGKDSPAYFLIAVVTMIAAAIGGLILGCHLAIKSIKAFREGVQEAATARPGAESIGGESKSSKGL